MNPKPLAKLSALPPDQNVPKWFQLVCKNDTCAYHPRFMYAAARFPYRTAAEGQQLIALLYKLMANV
jgi:hypothetical protein